MSVKVITIDFWNTLFDSSNGKARNDHRQRSLINEIDTLGEMVKPDKFQEALHATWEYFNHIWKNEHRTPTPDDTVIYFWDYLKLPREKESMDKVIHAFSNSVLEYPPQLLPGVKDTLIKLSNTYDLALISDTGFSPGTILKELMHRNEISQYFKAFSFSDETGVSKPDEKAYFTVLNPLNCDPKNALHIGDIEATDVAGAKNLDMHAIRYNGNPTDYINMDNPQETIADIELDSWNKIYDYILNLK